MSKNNPIWPNAKKVIGKSILIIPVASFLLYSIYFFVLTTSKVAVSSPTKFFVFFIGLMTIAMLAVIALAYFCYCVVPFIWNGFDVKYLIPKE